MRAGQCWLVLGIGAELALTACGFEVRATGSDGGASGDGSVRLDACVTISPFVDTCMFPIGSDLVLAGAHRFDTDSGRLSSAGMDVAVDTALVMIEQVEVRALFVDDLRLANGATLRAIGSKPVAIFAQGRISLEASAVIDVSEGGAGARTQCPSGPTRGEANGGGAGGGGGA